MSLSPSDDSTVSAFLTTLSLEEHSNMTPDLGTVPIHNAFLIDFNSCCSSSKLPFTFPVLRPSQTPIQMTSDGTIPYLWHWYRINGILTTEDTAISIPSIHQSYVRFVLQTNSILSHQVKQWHPQTTLWHLLNTVDEPSILQQFDFHPSQPFNGELGMRVTLPMLQIVMK